MCDVAHVLYRRRDGLMRIVEAATKNHPSKAVTPNAALEITSLDRYIANHAVLCQPCNEVRIRRRGRIAA